MHGVLQVISMPLGMQMSEEAGERVTEVTFVFPSKLSNVDAAMSTLLHFEDIRINWNVGIKFHLIQ